MRDAAKLLGTTARIGWIVDVQNDFMLPPERGGRLYVHDLFDDGSDRGATQIVPALIKGIGDLFGSILAFFSGGRPFTYEDEAAASRAVAENLAAIRKGTFRPGAEEKSGTLTPAGQSTNISIGQVVLPNVKGTDAKKFVTNLENISG